MPGPAAKQVKHGHTATTGANDWIEVEDVPFEDAPPLPTLGGRKKWHQWTLDWYAEASRMPHCRLWRDTDWRKLFYLAKLYDAQMRADEPKTSADTEIRRREAELGFDMASRRALKIRYVPVRAEDDGPDLRAEGQRSVEQDLAAADPQTAGSVIPLADRRRNITKTA